MKKRVTFFVLLALSQPLLACSVPVFRYALERWQSAPYRLLLVKHGELNESELSALKHLTDYTDVNSANRCNLRLFDVSVADLSESPDLKGLSSSFDGSRFILLLPAEYRDNKPIADFPVTRAVVDRLISSPMREDLIRRIEGGTTATWVLLDSGDKESDDAAYKKLNAATRKAMSLIKLSEDVAMPNEDKEVDADDKLQSAVPLKIQFDVIRLKRDDVNETLLRKLLMRVESDLKDMSDKPIAIPIFGRGRALHALVGAGINEDNVLYACNYLSNACSCQVKEQNPGVDLLFSKNWDDLIMEDFIEERELPPLPGVGDLKDEKTVPSSQNCVSESTKGVEKVKVDKKESPHIPKIAVVEDDKANTLVELVAIVVAFLFIAGLVVIRKGKS